MTSELLTASGHRVIGAPKPRVTVPMMFPQATASGYAQWLNGIAFRPTRGIVMWRPGSIVGWTMNVEVGAATAGKVTFDLRINDVVIGLIDLFIYALDGTSTKNIVALQEPGISTFVAGDKLSAFAKESDNMVWGEGMTLVELELDT